MTSPFLVARKPLEERPEQTEVGQTVRRPSSLLQPVQAKEPDDTEPRPLWQQKVDAQRVKIDESIGKNVIIPSAANTTLRENYTNIFPIIQAQGATAQAGQEAATENRRAREAAVARAKIDAINQAAIEDAYKRLAAIETGQAGPNRTIPGSGGSGATYSGDVVWDSSDAAVADLMRKAGFPEDQIGMGLAVAFGESSFRKDAMHNNPNGSVDLGIFQINNKAHADKLSAAGNAWNDPQVNANLAYQVWKEAGGSWSPWVVYQNGVTPRAVPASRLQVTAAPATQGGVYATGNGSLRNAAVNKATVVYNLPYVWGGDSLTTGVDCSGLVQQVYKQLGISTPRQARAQAAEGAVGHRVGSVNDLQPGDLVAFQWAGGYAGPNIVSHIAIYAGNNEIIEAYGGDHGRRRSLGNSQQDRGAIYIHVKFPGE